jgi:hypothetical protein
MRRLSLLAVAVFLLQGSCLGARKATPKNLPPHELVELARIRSEIKWALNFSLQGAKVEPRDKPLSSAGLAGSIGSDRFLKDASAICPRDLLLRKKYQKSLKAFVLDFSYAGGEVYYFNDRFGFSGYKGGVCLDLCTVASPNVWNTLRLNGHQRAAKVFNQYVPGLASSLFKCFHVPADIAYYSVGIVYGTRDASEDTSCGPDAEFLTVTAKAEMWAKFAKSLITDQQFADSAELLLDESGQTTDRRVGLKLTD